MPKIHIIAEARLKPGARQEVMPLLQKLVDGSRAEEGNIAYEILEDIENPDHFFFVEVWASQEAIDRHNSSAHFKEFAQAITPWREKNQLTRLVKTL